MVGDLLNSPLDILIIPVGTILLFVVVLICIVVRASLVISKDASHNIIQSWRIEATILCRPRLPTPTPNPFPIRLDGAERGPAMVTAMPRGEAGRS